MEHGHSCLNIEFHLIDLEFLNHDQMKKLFVPVLSVAFLLTSCFSQGGGLGLGAAGTGAAIGGVVGSVVGANSNSPYGSAIGTVIGTVAGAAIGNAVSKKSSGNVFGNIFGAGLVDSNNAVATSSLSLTNFRFVDANKNQAIEAGESCQIVFDIVNNGSASVSNITPVLELTQKVKGLTVGNVKTIVSLPAKSKVTYSIPVTASTVLKNGNAPFRAYVKDGSGTNSGTQTFSIPTKQK